MSSLVERLGRPADARLVIIVADGLGMANASNQAVYRSMRDGIATAATLQVPCPWSRGAATEYRGEGVGVSLTVNAEHGNYPWGPITQAPSLLGGMGGFASDPSDFWEHADVEEVRRECRAQIERAILWGFDVTHLASHLGAISSRPEFFDAYLDLALEFRLPISLPDPGIDLGFDARALAAEEGVLVPDHEVPVPLPRSSRAGFEEAIRSLAPGVTELHVRPADDTPELRAITPDWAARVADAHLVTSDWHVRAELERSGAELISYRPLRQLQRS